MAERYYFRLVGSSEVIEDETGALADSIEDAQTEAMHLIAELRERAELPDPAERWRMEIHDANGVVLRAIQLF